MKRQYISPEVNVHNLVIETAVMVKISVRANWGFEDDEIGTGQSVSEEQYKQSDEDHDVEIIGGKDFDVI